MPSSTFVVGGFAEIETGSRDYGMGVVRMDPRAFGEQSEFNRHTLVKLTVKQGTKERSTYAAFRKIDPESTALPPHRHLLCLEYEDRLQLGVEKGQEYLVDVRRAGLYGQYKYFRDHPNIVLRLYTRYTFVVGLIGAAVGATASMLVRQVIK